VLAFWFVWAGAFSSNQTQVHQMTQAASDQPRRDIFDRITVVIAGVGVILAACALLLNSCQLSTIKDNAHRQLRAYVMVDNKALRVDDFTNQIALKIRIKNFGTTPAHNVSNWVCLAIRETPLSSVLKNYPTDKVLSKSVLALKV
jgi:hypothetical protein